MAGGTKGGGEWFAGWGGQGAEGRGRASEDLESATVGAQLSRGLGRSYGDSAVPAQPTDVVVRTPLADRILAFDPTSGRLTAEAGFALSELYRLLLPRGWFTPVSPGTKFVTLGGMVASDVHGKNHHVNGCFGEAVESLRLRTAGGDIVTCSRTENNELFRATVGGMGLTGHILEVSCTLARVPSPWIWQESSRVRDIDEFVAGLREAASAWPMTVGWIDCLARGKNLGRGILMRGRWATREEAPAHAPPERRKLRVPFVVPDFLLNPFTVRVFNALYYAKHIPRERRGIVHPDTFFYPLDALHDWNRLYGRAGFTQYQCVIPTEAGADAPRRFVELLARTGAASPLCVIKDCGKEGTGMLSFPKPGVSVAVDIPIRAHTQEVVDTLNRFILDVGGRIYLTKDGFTRPEHFAAMEPRLAEWQRVRHAWDPENRIRSAQSVRVLGDQLK